MKIVLIVLLTLFSLNSPALSILSPIETIRIVIPDTVLCEQEGIVFRMTIEPSDNDANKGKDHYAYALLDARGVVLNFEEGYEFTHPNPISVDLHGFLTDITARPVTFVIFDKDTEVPAVGANITAQYNYAVANYEFLIDKVFDPVAIGIQNCEPIPELFCHDPLIYKSSLEALICEVSDDPINDFTAPLAMTSICIAPGTIEAGVDDIEFCQGSCGSGNGCEVQLTTNDTVNFTENQFCSSYQYNVPVFDVAAQFSGGCDLNIVGDYYLGASWDGNATGPYSWMYTNPVSELNWFEFDFSEVGNCQLNYAPYLAFIEGVVADRIEDFYSNHLNLNQNNAFCQLNE